MVYMAKRNNKINIVARLKGFLPFLIILLGIFYFFLRLNNSIYSYQSTSIPVCQLDIPQTLSFDDSKFTINLRAGDIKDNTWTTYDDAASWHINTRSKECTHGNLVMWAHNRRGLFAELYNVKEDEILSVAGTSGIRKYKVVDIRDVDPTDLTLVNVDDDRLTMYTCDGFLDSKRRFVIAKPV